MAFIPASSLLAALYFGKVSINKYELWLKDQIDLFDENRSSCPFENDGLALNAAVFRDDRFNLSFESHKFRNDLKTFSFPDLKYFLAHKIITKNLKRNAF
jgi:hypothetical protein